jgi:hypothetical protein
VSSYGFHVILEMDCDHADCQICVTLTAVPSLGQAFSALFCIALYFLFRRLWRSSPSNIYLKYYREQLGGDGLFLCEIEIVADGITTIQGGAETRRSRSAVKEII